MKPSALSKLAWSLPAWAALPAAAAEPAALGAGSLLQAAFGLLMVLALIFACAWAGRRFGLQRPRGNGMVKIVSGAMVGQRERVVVVEIGKSWLVLGVTPNQVNALHTMPAEELPPDDAAPFGAGAVSAFSRRLRASLDRRRSD